MKRPWMSWYPGDHIRDTYFLTRAQDGSYRMLIDEYWMRGGLPNDETVLARIARMTPEEWTSERHIFIALFGPNWTHKRIDAEIAKCVSLSETRSTTARKRWPKTAVGNVISFNGAGE